MHATRLPRGGLTGPRTLPPAHSPAVRRAAVPPNKGSEDAPPAPSSTSTPAPPPAPSTSAADPASPPDLGVGLKAAWYTAEAVGNAVGAAKAVTGGKGAGAGASPSSPSPPTRQQAKLPWADAVAAIRADYDAVYFVSGAGDLAAYDPDCYFADPFAGFSSTARFRNNVSNLGSTLSDVKLNVTSFEADEAAGTIRTAWKFSGIVNALPWRPRLAAAGSTTHTLDPGTGLVTKHVEAWASSPGQVLAALVKPAAEVPGNRWERGAAALAEGDVRGAVAAGLKVLSLAAFHGAGFQAAARLVHGSGGGGGGWEAFLWGAGVVMLGLDALVPIFGTGGTGRPVKRK
jgi:hypothetical protein